MKEFLLFGKYARRVFLYKVWNAKTFSLFVLLLFVNYLYCKPLLHFSIVAQEKVTPWVLPFMMSDIYYLVLFLMGVIYYFSDVPFMQYQNMYQIVRTGRIRWVLGQLFVIVIQSFLLIAASIFMTWLCLSTRLVFSTEWGKVLHTAALTNAGAQYDFLFGISYDAIVLFEPLQLMILVFFVGGLVIGFVGFMMFAISLFAGRAVAVATATAMVVMIFAIENAHPIAMATMSRFAPMSWLQVVKIGAKQYGRFVLPPLPYMLGALLLGMLLLCVVICLKVRRVEFEWCKED